MCVCNPLKPVSVARFFKRTEELVLRRSGMRNIGFFPAGKLAALAKQSFGRPEGGALLSRNGGWVLLAGQRDLQPQTDIYIYLTRKEWRNSEK